MDLDAYLELLRSHFYKQFFFLKRCSLVAQDRKYTRALA